MNDSSNSSGREALFQNHYVWFVFLSVMDILLAAIALQHNAHEANILAAWLLDRYGIAGLVMLKFAAVPLVIVLCEFIGRRQPATGRRLAEWVVALAAVPIVVTLALLLLRVYGGL